MPGPVYVPGATITSRPPPKPITRPWIRVPNLPADTTTAGLAEPLAAWRGLWHAVGFNLPFYINHSRASRRALRSFGATHG